MPNTGIRSCLVDSFGVVTFAGLPTTISIHSITRTTQSNLIGMVFARPELPSVASIEGKKVSRFGLYVRGLLWLEFVITAGYLPLSTCGKSMNIVPIGMLVRCQRIYSMPSNWSRSLGRESAQPFSSGSQFSVFRAGWSQL